MGKRHLTFRLSATALGLIEVHQRKLSLVNRRAIDRTEALEDIILNFHKRPSLSDLFHRRKHAPDPQTRSLEAFASA